MCEIAVSKVTVIYYENYTSLIVFDPDMVWQHLQGALETAVCSRRPAPEYIRFEIHLPRYHSGSGCRPVNVSNASKLCTPLTVSLPMIQTACGL